LITRIIFGEEYSSLISLFFSFFDSPFISFLLGTNILLNILFSNTLLTFFPQYEWPIFPPIQNSMQTYRVLFSWPVPVNIWEIRLIFTHVELKSRYILSGMLLFRKTVLRYTCVV
jgi:hypothetical protein